MASALLLSLFSVATGWADGGYYQGYSQNDGFQNIYKSQGGAAYPQYFPRIEPETPYRAQYQYQPLRASTSTYSPPHKALSTKIADGLTDLWKSPIVKSGVIGTGIGVGAAALTKHMSILHGAWVGAAYGAGFGAMDETTYFKQHPLVRKTAKGAVIGLGAAALTGAAALGPATAVGAGIGAGVHYLKTH